MDSKVTRCDPNLHEMDPCAKKCPQVKSIGFTARKLVVQKHGSYVFVLLKFQNLKMQNQFWRNAADYPILQNTAFDTSPRQENIKL